MIRLRIRAWWLRRTGRRWDHDLLRDAERRTEAARNSHHTWHHLSANGNGGTR